MSTKNKILREALKQFNKSGVESITTRHIASALKMSQGNLHYHYPNKNEIIQALYNEFIIEIKNASRYSPEEHFDKENVLKSMYDSFKFMYRYRFLFCDNEIVWRKVPALKKQMLSLLHLKKMEIIEIIRSYKEKGILRSDISSEQLDFLAQQFIFNIGTWLNASEYLEIKKNKAEYFARFTFRQWLPYLEQNEMKEWEKLL